MPVSVFHAAPSAAVHHQTQPLMIPILIVLHWCCVYCFLCVASAWLSLPACMQVHQQNLVLQGVQQANWLDDGGTAPPLPPQDLNTRHSPSLQSSPAAVLVLDTRPEVSISKTSYPIGDGEGRSDSRGAPEVESSMQGRKAERPPGGMEAGRVAEGGQVRQRAETSGQTRLAGESRSTTPRKESFVKEHLHDASATLKDVRTRINALLTSLDTGGERDAAGEHLASEAQLMLSDLAQVVRLVGEAEVAHDIDWIGDAGNADAAAARERTSDGQAADANAGGSGGPGGWQKTFVHRQVEEAVGLVVVVRERIGAILASLRAAPHTDAASQHLMMQGQKMRSDLAHVLALLGEAQAAHQIDGIQDAPKAWARGARPGPNATAQALSVNQDSEEVDGKSVESWAQEGKEEQGQGSSPDSSDLDADGKARVHTNQELQEKIRDLKDALFLVTAQPFNAILSQFFRE
jgi:hypothetical protein